MKLSLLGPSAVLFYGFLWGDERKVIQRGACGRANVSVLAFLLCGEEGDGELFLRSPAGFGAGGPLLSLVVREGGVRPRWP